MKDKLSKLIFIIYVFVLINLIIFFMYIGINMYLNKGNKVINLVLLSLTIVYLVLYVINLIFDINKKVIKRSTWIFKRLKRLLGFISACLVVASLFTNTNNSFITIFLAIISIIFYLIYFFIDLIYSWAMHEVKKLKSRVENRYANRG